MANTREVNYFVIDLGEDGDIYITKMTKERLEKSLNDDIEEMGQVSSQEVLKMSTQINLVNPGKVLARQIIIKGEQVYPTPIEVVSRVEII